MNAALDTSASRRRRWRRVLRTLTLVGLVILLVAIRHSLLEATQRLTAISPLALAAIPLFALWTAVSALAWRRVIRATGIHHVPSLVRLCIIRLQGQSVNLVLPLAGLGGEALRAASLTRATGQGDRSTASIALDVTAAITAAFWFAGLGALLGWRIERLPEALRLVAVIGSFALATLIGYAPRLLSRPRNRSAAGRGSRLLQGLGQAVGEGGRAGFATSAGWHLVARILMVGEAWLFAQALGLDLSVWHAVFATAWMTLFASILFFIPGQLGAADGGLALGLLWAGLPWNAGLAVALGRRLRQLLVGTVGLLLVLVELRRHDDGVASSALDLSASKPGMGG